MSRLSKAVSLIYVFAFCQLVAAQSISIPAGQSAVETCFQAANRVTSGQGAPQWQEVQPCLNALELSLDERERVSTLTNLGLIQSNLGDFDAARASFDQALLVSPSYSNTYLNRANLFYLERDFEAAIRDYNEALRLNPESVDILYLNRGMAYQNLQEYGLAETDFHAALAARPGWALVAEKLEALELERSSLEADR